MGMKAPFVYGKLATGEYFTDRNKELAQLSQNFISGTNTILISPRRWGKSSLVLKTINKVKRSHKDIRIITIDLFNIRSEEEFYKILSEKVFKSISNKLDNVIANTRKFLSGWNPNINVASGSQVEFSLNLNWSEVSKRPDEILNLTETIAKEKNISFIICIDEFQNMAYFKKPLAFQKKLRSHWQKHEHTSYCLYGSKRHMLMEVFTSSNMPFYKFGDLIFLNKIPTKYWANYIVKQFRSTQKEISKEQASTIARLVCNHPYYTQQLAQQCWLRTSKTISDEIIEESINSLMLQLSLLFQNMIESLSNSQINYLRAIIDKAEKLSSKETIDKYHLGTSANVIVIKKALVNKDIIDNQHGRIEINDPVFERWLRECYFV